MFLSFIKNHSIALLGMGRSTLSVYNFLSNKGFDLYIWDDNLEVREKYKNSFMNIVDYKEWDFASLDAIIVSPGIALYYPNKHSIVDKAAEYKVPCLSDIELFYMFFPNYKYIGVTGSNGKSTLVTLLNKILNLANKPAVIAGNIGIPIFSLNKLPLNTYIILELSSFQLSFVKKMRLHIALIINIYHNHNDYHGNYCNYQQAKFNVFKNQHNNDIAIINSDEAYVEDLFKSNILNSNIISISSKGNVNANFFFKEGKLYQHDISNTDNGDNVNLVADFNKEFNVTSNSFLQLILFAYAVSNLLHIDIKQFLTAIKHFKGLPHRQEILSTTNNIIFINDSKATTAEAAAAILEQYHNIYWLVGGIRKSGAISKCKPFFKNVNHVFIFGKDQNSFKKEFQNQLNFSCYTTLKEATIAAYNYAKKDLVVVDENHSFGKIATKVILLSPIGTSFDEFQNFEHRGNTFKQIVQELINASI